MPARFRSNLSRAHVAHRGSVARSAHDIADSEVISPRLELPVEHHLFVTNSHARPFFVDFIQSLDRPSTRARANRDAPETQIIFTFYLEPKDTKLPLPSAQLFVELGHAACLHYYSGERLDGAPLDRSQDDDAGVSPGSTNAHEPRARPGRCEYGRRYFWPRDRRGYGSTDSSWRDRIRTSGYTGGAYNWGYATSCWEWCADAECACYVASWNPATDVSATRDDTEL